MIPIVVATSFTIVFSGLVLVVPSKDGKTLRAIIPKRVGVSQHVPAHHPVLFVDEGTVGVTGQLPLASINYQETPADPTRRVTLFSLGRVGSTAETTITAGTATAFTLDAAKLVNVSTLSVQSGQTPAYVKKALFGFDGADGALAVFSFSGDKITLKPVVGTMTYDMKESGSTPIQTGRRVAEKLEVKVTDGPDVFDIGRLRISPAKDSTIYIHNVPIAGILGIGDPGSDSDPDYHFSGFYDMLQGPTYKPIPYPTGTVIKKSGRPVCSLAQGIAAP